MNQFKDHKKYLKIVILELKKININISEKTLKKINDNMYNNI
jgi:hypothetical protein